MKNKEICNTHSVERNEWYSSPSSGGIIAQGWMTAAEVA